MLEKEPYWDQLVNYYYDNIHWNSEPTVSIYAWLRREYHANTNLYSRYIQFDEPKYKTLFAMRWL